MSHLQKQTTEFVLTCFSQGLHSRLRRSFTPRLESITRQEICAVVLKSLVEQGCFPPNAEMIDGDPAIFLGEQIRKLKDGRFLVANVNFYAYKANDSPSSRTFDSAAEAVHSFVRATVSNYLCGVPVI